MWDRRHTNGGSHLFPLLHFFFFVTAVHHVINSFGQVREANKEVAFLLLSPHVHTLSTLQPFVSRNGLVVTPMPTLMDGVSVTEGLCPTPCEVVHIFHLPPETLLDPELASKEILVPLGSEDGLYKEEVVLVRCVYASCLRSTYRIHRLWSAESTVKGVTAYIPVRLHFLTLFCYWLVDQLLLELACDCVGCVRARLYFSGARHAN
ncbi:hypothetical protein BJV78DRAFT_1129973 [Lactifluus subvellereus]|nr:hypothetical protein BJV78DRAFT_1129973 [Lactifluus subvellereus]